MLRGKEVQRGIIILRKEVKQRRCDWKGGAADERSSL